ncbi:hypothetical protein BMIN10S_03050 [Bosea minatitlanensis]
MTGRPYIPHAGAPRDSALSVIRGAVLGSACLASLAAFGAGFPALLFVILGG